MRQQAFIQPDDENLGKFQPFGGVQGQQGGALGLFGQGILVGNQRQDFQKIGSGRVLHIHKASWRSSCTLSQRSSPTSLPSSRYSL